MNLPRFIKTQVTRPAIIMLAVSLLLLCGSIFFTHHGRSYNSDDVSWQVILAHWKPFSGETVSLGSSDNFVDKIPYFALLGHFLQPSRRTLLIESTLLACGGFTLFYISALYFMRKVGTKLSYRTLLPFAWLSSFGFTFAELYLCPIWRGFEIGVTFAVFALTAILLSGNATLLKSIRAKALFFLVTLITGVMIYSDPYFLYFTVGPIAIFTLIALILKSVKTGKALTMGLGIILSLIFSKLTSLLAVQAGIKIIASYPAQFIDFPHLSHNIIISLENLLTIFNANFFGKVIAAHLSLPVTLLNFCLLATILYVTFRSIRKASAQKKQTINRLWVPFFSGLILFTFVVYATSTLVDPTTYRYFFIVVFCGVLTLANFMGKAHNTPVTSLLTVLLIGATLGNIASSVHGTHGFIQPGDVGGNSRNNINLSIIHTVKDAGLTKGYAGYWDANINTYLSGNTTRFLPITCSTLDGSGFTGPFYFLIDNAAFKQPAKHSFYLVDPDITAPTTCSEQSLVSQFGTPAKVFEVGDKSIWVYNYDIGSRMQL